MDNLESFNSKVSKMEQSKELLEKKLNDLEDEIRLNLSEIVQLVDNLPDNHEDNLALETLKKTQNTLESLLENSRGKTSHKGKSLRKCRYYNRGYCKFGDRCNFTHPLAVCDNFLMNNFCYERGCQLRHPKDCRFWTKSTEGCIRHDPCQYLHRESMKLFVYSCDQCEYRNPNKNSLERHVATCCIMSHRRANGKTNNKHEHE